MLGLIVDYISLLLGRLTGEYYPGLRFYIQRIHAISELPDFILLQATVYLQRLVSLRDSTCSPGRAHDLIRTCLLVSDKVARDCCYRNVTWIKITASCLKGQMPSPTITIHEINCQERHLLSMLAWNVQTTLSELRSAEMRAQILRRTATAGYWSGFLVSPGNGGLERPKALDGGLKEAIKVEGE